MLGKVRPDRGDGADGLRRAFGSRGRFGLFVRRGLGGMRLFAADGSELAGADPQSRPDEHQNGQKPMRFEPRSHETSPNLLPSAYNLGRGARVFKSCDLHIQSSN